MLLSSSNTLILVIRKDCQPKIARYLVFVVFTARHFIICLKHYMLLQTVDFPSVWLMRNNKSSLPETHALPVYL